MELAWFIQKADACYIYDNSTDEPEFLGGKIGDAAIRFQAFPGDLQRVFEMAGIEFVDVPEA